MTTQLIKAARLALEAGCNCTPDGHAAMEALRAALEQPLKMQVHPSEFVKLVAGKENMTGIPAYFTEWPNYD